MQQIALIANRYRLIEQIDSGGFSQIYRALDLKTDREVAVKMLRQEYAKSARHVSRFKKECSIALKLKHPNIVSVSDAGQENGQYFMVMEYIDGRTLKHIISINETLPLQFVVDVSKKLCMALEYAHAKGVIHRDIKPQNVLIDLNGEPHLCDFGIAERVRSEEALQGEEVLGSVHYFSPEQAKGEQVDGRSDIYSLGIMMHEMLTGSVPFEGETSMEIALKHLNEQVPDADAQSAEKVPRSLCRILRKATQKKKSDRYRSAFAMYRDLTRCLEEPDGDYVKLAIKREERAKINEEKRHKKAIAIIVCAAVALAGIVAAIVLCGASVDNKKIFVPNVVNDTLEDAQAVFRERGLVMEITYVFDDTVGEGLVISQEPQAGTSVESTQSVMLTVSQGPELIYMPEVIGLSEEEAKMLLTVEGILRYDIIEEVNPEVPAGYVFAQIPDAEEQVTADDDVVLKVSTDAADAAEQ